MRSLLFATVGSVMVVAGTCLALDLGGAVAWWLDYARSQREMWGRLVGPSYDEGSARVLGAVVAILGAVFLVAGLT